MIFLLDNYDSFTYNLYQYLSELGEEVVVDRNDKTTVENIAEMQPEKVVISPGPSNPANAGISKDVARYFGEHGTPVLGVCLGHQCIGEAFGGTVTGAGEIMHGKSSMIYHDGKGVYEGLPNPFEAIRYHSLAILPDSVPEELEVTARTDNGVVMGVRHREYPIVGIQFHPERIRTEVGKDLLRNFLKM